MSNREDNSLLPGGVEIITYVIASALILTLLNVSQIWGHLSDGITVDVVTFGANANILWLKIDALRRSSLLGTASVMFFWGAIGSLIYAGIWLMQNSLLKIKEDEELVEHEQNTKRRGNVIQSVAAHYLFFAALTILILGYVFFFLAVIVPSCKLLFLSAVTSSFALRDILSLIGTVIAFAGGIAILVVLVKLYARFWRLYLKPVV